MLRGLSLWSNEDAITVGVGGTTYNTLSQSGNTYRLNIHITGKTLYIYHHDTDLITGVATWFKIFSFTTPCDVMSDCLDREAMCLYRRQALRAPQVGKHQDYNHCNIIHLNEQSNI